MAKPGFHQLHSLKEAMDLLWHIAPKAENELVNIEACLDRISAEDVSAPLSIPSFEKSAMDGYVVVSSDTFTASMTQPIELTMVDEIFPGVVSNITLNKGQCMEIATGAPLPEGADGVVMVEYTEKEDKQIRIFKPAVPGEHIIRIGSDFSEHQKVIPRGTLLGPRHTAVLSGLGITELKVFKRINIGICSSGNEIVRPPKTLKPGQSFDMNSRALLDAFRSYGCETTDFGIAIDELSSMIQILQTMAESCDIVVMSGGSSLGSKDLMMEALEKTGQILVHGIAVKPGKPTLIGTIGSKLFLGLPGHPASALSNFYILMEPLLNHIYQRNKVFRSLVHARLTSKVASTIGRFEYLPVQLDIAGDDYMAKPVMRGSSAISSLVLADGYIEIHENIEVLDKGTLVQVILFT